VSKSRVPIVPKVPGVPKVRVPMVRRVHRVHRVHRVLRNLNVILIVGLSSIVVVLVGEARQAAAWPQWRGPGRDGVARLVVPATWPQTLTKRWEITVGAGHASPVVAGNRVVLHSREGDREIARALDLSSGNELWRNEYAAPYTMNPAARGHGPGPKSTPVVAGERVFTFGISGILSALDLATGRLLWRTEAPASPPEFGTAMSPVVVDSTVIVHIGADDAGALTAFDAATGKPRWRWTGDGPSYASPVVATIAGTRQLVTQSENAVVGIAAANGQLLWRVPFKTSFDQNSITPVVLKDIVIYSGLDNGTSAMLVTTKGATWTTVPLWKNEQVSMYMSTPVASGNTLFGLSHRSRGQFFALDLTTGKTLWTTAGREAENASIILAGDLLLLSTTNAELIIARTNPARFDEIKRYSIANSAVWAHPAFTERTILVKDVDKLICWGI
jgi:outer membrane protein assembly factor BamB